MPRKRRQDACNKEEKTDLGDSKKRRTINSCFKKLIENMYGMEMPDDLYLFHQYLSEKDHKDNLSLLDLQPAGPLWYMFHDQEEGYDIDVVTFHMKWRFYYDVPEFLTLFISKNEQQLNHIGYYRDDPESVNSNLVVSNSGKNCKLNLLGDNFFSAFSAMIKAELKEGKPTNSKKLNAFLKQIETFAEEENIGLLPKSQKFKDREKKVVCKSFHGLGIVVPVGKDGVGYRPIHYNTTDLKRLLKKIVDANNDSDRISAFQPIQEMVNYVQMANDECDYGMGLELGIDLFCYGSTYFHKMAKLLLTMAYQLLNRDLYGKICERHLDDRREKDMARS